MGTSEKSEGHSLITSKKHIKDIEAHCRKIHADAVVDSFIMFFTVPLKLMCRLISARKSKHIEKIQVA